MAELQEFAVRFVIGGAVVSAFAIVGNLFKPKSFAGLFGAAPSVALATLALTIHKNGRSYASTEARSMLLGAIALTCYSAAVTYVLTRWRRRALTATLWCMPIWFATAFGLSCLLLR